MDTVLYGAAYYPEYMPYERLEQDVQLMQQAGISVVRMGESSWGLWEPQDGHFEFAWMDRVIDRMQKAGIKVILGTPTYSVPAWMYKEHPEIFITRFDGQTITFGYRQNTDLMNPVYRSYCERIIRKLLEHYKDNPAVIGWQIDNETSSGAAANPDVQAGFVAYLQNKFKTVDELNKDLGLELLGPAAERLDRDSSASAAFINPGWKLEWERYQQWMTTDFLAWQARIVNQYKRPDQFITHDLAGPPRPKSMSTTSPALWTSWPPIPITARRMSSMGSGSSMAGRLHPFAQADELSGHRNQRADDWLGFQGTVSSLRRATAPRRLYAPFLGR